MPIARTCCSLTRSLVSLGIDCSLVSGGITDVWIACIGDLTITTRSCSEEVTYDTDGDGNTETVTGDARVIGLAPVNAGETPFIEVETRTDSAEHTWNIDYDPTTSNVNRSESLTFQMESKDRFIYCTLQQDLIGMEIVILFREKGTGRYYLMGYGGDLTITNITGGTGTDEVVPISVTASIENAESLFLEVLFDDSVNGPAPSPSETQTAIEGLVLA